ncbi:MAG: histidine kinase [Bacteroidota bacterium]
MLVFTFTLMMVWTGLCGTIFYFTKLKSFKYYAAYTFFLGFYIGQKLSGFFQDFNLYSIDWLPDINWYPQLLYNCFYLIFAVSFLELEKHLPRLNRIILRISYSYLAVGSAFYAYLLMIGKSSFFVNFFLFLFLPVILPLAIYTIYKIFFIEDRLRYYVIAGSVIYQIFAYLSLYLSYAPHWFLGLPPITWFIFGIIAETIIFALGLGLRIYQIYEDRNQVRLSLIGELQKNEKLKESINQKLQIEVAQKTKEVATLIEDREEREKEKIRMQYEQELLEMNLTSLRNQMNPHFVFNALNSIKNAIIHKRKEDAVTYLNKFSKILREVLKNSNNKEYSLREEMDTLQLYANLENIRFENKIDFVIENQQGLNLNNFKIPPLLLQPLIENSIWHGLSLKKGRKEIIVRIRKDHQDYLTIEVEDNGIGRERAMDIKNKKVFQRPSIGLKLSEDRLKLFGKNRSLHHGIHIEDLYDEAQNPTGTKVILKIPI